ncbi:MAG: glycine--tRNA ligase subunit beta [Pseudomonadota bacterium]
MNAELFFEIGTEELPSGFILPALMAMKGLCEKKLTSARLEYKECEFFGTPRRLGIVVKEVVKKQPSITTEVVGPPYSVAFDKEGIPTKAAEGFARTQGVDVSQLKYKETPKGKYVLATKTERGKQTILLLKTLLPEIVSDLPFPKSMRWGEGKLSFARPIHWICAVFDKKKISFQIEDIKSSATTRGHRFMHNSAINVANFEDYLCKLELARVIPGIEQRKKIILSQAEELCRASGGMLLADNELLDTVANLVEFPVSCIGSFSSDFTALPHEVLITSMREHQKYFAVVDTEGRILPFFIAINNTAVNDPSLSIKGHERVLRARLEDARFFFREDKKITLDSMAEKLKGVLFQSKLGTMYQKACRLQELASYIASKIAPEKEENARRAAMLAKADLVSHMVCEFPKLQGVMGRIYAAYAGEPVEVCMAIGEHYLPTYAGDHVPGSVLGSIVGIADKIDTIVGCFGAGLIPTGASDPYALRRQALGIIHTLITNNIHISLKDLIEKGIALFEGASVNSREKIQNDVIAFIKHRLENAMVESGLPKDAVDSVLSISLDDIVIAKAKIEALAEVKNIQGFASAAVTFKRVVNIIKQQRRLIKEGTFLPFSVGAINTALFEQECESGLYKAVEHAAGRISQHMESAEYKQGLLLLADLKQPVDAFFNGVMVLTENEVIRNNRLNLLATVEALFAEFADFSKIES